MHVGFRPHAPDRMLIRVKHLRPLALALLPLCMFGLWTLFIYQFPPTDIVNAVGAKNGYWAILVLSFIGGLSTFITVPYHFVLMTLAAGGLNPFLLGTIATLGQGCGDATSYALGYSAGQAAPRFLQTWVDWLLAWSERRPYWKVALAVTLYGSVSPLSNDFILIPMGLARYPFLKIFVPLEIGNLFFNVGAGLVGAYGLASILGS